MRSGPVIESSSAPRHCATQRAPPTRPRPAPPGTTERQTKTTSRTRCATQESLRSLAAPACKRLNELLDARSVILRGDRNTTSMVEHDEPRADRIEIVKSMGRDHGRG